MFKNPTCGDLLVEVGLSGKDRVPGPVARDRAWLVTGSLGEAP